MGVAGGVLLLWGTLVAALWLARPDELRIRDTMRLLPDLVRLLRGLAGDDGVPRGVRVRLWLLLGYLALPIDLVPDFIPVLGYADDVIVVCWVLRSVLRATAFDLVEAHWPGTADGLAVVRRLTGVGPGGASRA